MTSTTIDKSAFDTPGTGRGLLDVFRYRYLLRLLIGKGTALRYHGSALGWIWSYVRPAVQFLIYYLVMGQILGMHHRVAAYPIYLFSGLVVVNFFNDAFGQATRAIVTNKALVRKIYMPRELFPLASISGSFIYFLPQLAVLVFVSLLFGWHPSWAALLFTLAGILIVGGFTVGLGLFFAAVNVRYRDAQNFVDIIRTVATWTAPVMYTWTQVHEIAKHHHWLYEIYMSNPLVVGVEFFHHGYWASVVPPDKQLGWPIGFDHQLIASLITIVVVILIGQLVFRRLERTFAQEL